MTPTSIPARVADSAPGRAMLVFAHPDDAEFTCGGTVARWAGSDSSICYVVATDGSKGGDASDLDDRALRKVREAEQLAAARLLGVADVMFLRHPDGGLAAVSSLREQLAAAIRRWRPDRLLTWDAWRLYQLHPDHRAVGLAAVEAVLAAANPRVFPAQLSEGLTPLRVPEIYLFGSDQPDVWIDIEETFQRKLDAVMLHRSQVSDPREASERVSQCNASYGGRSGLALAEAFKVLRPFCEL